MQKIDILITVGKEAEKISETASVNGMSRENIYECDSNKKAIEIIRELAKSGDAILLKASNGMNFQEIYESIK